MSKLKNFYNVYIFLFLFVITGCCSSVKKTNHYANEQFFDRITDSTVALAHFKNDKFSNVYCTGYFVDEKHIITARHCVLNNEEVSFVRQLIGDSPEAEEYIQKALTEYIRKMDDILVLKHSKSMDFAGSSFNQIKPTRTKLAFINVRTVGQRFPDFNDVIVLKVLDKKDYSKNWLKFANEDPYVGDKVFSINCLNGNPWFYTGGFISKVFYVFDEQKNKKVANLLVANMTVYPGASGGPLLNERGEIIGITSYMEVGRGNQIMSIGFYIPNRYVKKYYESIL